MKNIFDGISTFCSLCLRFVRPGESVVFAYNGKLAVEYLRDGLTSSSGLNITTAHQYQCNPTTGNLDSTHCDRREMIIGVCVRVSCTQIQDSMRPLRKCTKIAGEQKKDSFTHPQSCSSNYMRIYTRLHAYSHIYIYTDTRSVVVCCSKREKWLAEGRG